MKSMSTEKTTIEKVTIKVDGQEYQVNAGDNLLEACLGLAQDIPYFCWHPSLGSVGSCRQCGVQIYKDEDDQRGRMVMACMTQVAEGMIVSLNADFSKNFREQNIEVMMANHPHDCPVCEEGGECHLQDMTIQSGHTQRRYTGSKKTYQNQNLGPCVGHEMNRCIACYRCVRFYNDYAGGDDLAVLGSRENVYFGRHEEGCLESPFSGNLAEVCPTGVFFDKSLSDSFTRKWDLQAAPSICGHCSLGCNITPAERNGRIKRVTNRYHSQVNGYFICDRGRYGFAYNNSSDRLHQASVTPEGGEPTACGYASALDYVGQIFSELGADNVLALGSSRASTEENFALRALVGEDNFYAGLTETEQTMQNRIVEILSSRQVHGPSIREIEAADAIVILGEDLMQSAPRMALAVRQASRNEGLTQAAALGIPSWQDDSVRILTQDQRSPIISVNSTGSELDGICAHSLQLDPASVTEFARAVTGLIKAGAPDTLAASENSRLDEAAKTAAIATAKYLSAAKRPLIICGTSANQPALIDAAADLAISLADGEPAWLSYVLGACNSMGLTMLDNNTHIGALQQRLQQQNQPQALIVMQPDLDQALNGTQLSELAELCKHLIVIDQFASELSRHADVVIPAASLMETEGTLVNNEGRAQRFFSVLASSDSGKMDNWRMLVSLARLTQPDSALAQCSVYDDLVNLLAQTGGRFTDWENVAPTSEFRVAGMKMPRQSHRFSGRTSLYADQKVSENKQPVDEDSALSFSMEGSPIDRPAALNPLVWTPGWNSNEAINKFQEEINGPLKGGDPGLLLFPQDAGTDIELNGSAADDAAPESDDNKILAVAHARLFDGEALSTRAASLRQRAPRSCVRIHPDTAKRMSLPNQALVDVSLDASHWSLPLVFDDHAATGVLILPAQADAKISARALPANVTVKVAEKTAAAENAS